MLFDEVDQLGEQGAGTRKNRGREAGEERAGRGSFKKAGIIY